MLKHEWVDSGTIRKETGIIPATIHRLLKVNLKHGEIEKEFRHYNTSASGRIGTAKRYKYFWRLKPC